MTVSASTRPKQVVASTGTGYSTLLGSPRVHTPFKLGMPRPGTTWQPSTREQDERQCCRRSLRCTVTLQNCEPEQGDLAFQAECSNISDTGLFAIVPMGYGVAIGQKYIFRLEIEEHGPQPEARQVVSQRGEILRAELMLGDDGHADSVGVGVRLFGPRSA